MYGYLSQRQEGAFNVKKHRHYCQITSAVDTSLTNCTNKPTISLDF